MHRMQDLGCELSGERARTDARTEGKIRAKSAARLGYSGRRFGAGAQDCFRHHKRSSRIDGHVVLIPVVFVADPCVMAEDLENANQNQGASKPMIAGSEPLPASLTRPAGVSTKKEENDFPFAVLVSDVYEGPLDLLLDLIRKQDIDIYDIPIARITAQYLTYVEKLRELDVNVAA